MEGDYIKINEWLTPLSWLYGLGVRFRNTLFDIGVLKSQSFSIPVISVGNITVGGSGKTPHVEFLIRLLKDKAKVTVLSRGYKRKSKGYQLAGKTSTISDIGDEPYQMYTKFKDIHVAVDKDRCHGIRRIIEDDETKDTDVILLDDAYQHRYVKPGINILLVDYHRLIIYDKLLPAGRLREPMQGKERADVVIITKCPKDLKPMNFRVLDRAMNLRPYQHLFFTCLDYGNLKQVYGKKEMRLDDIRSTDSIMLITGIASPEQMISDLSPHTKNILHLRYADHHAFDNDDIADINEKYATLPKGSLLITTEKDVPRLNAISGLSKEVQENIYVLPIEIRFMLDQEEKFNEYILSDIHKNSKNSTLLKNNRDTKIYKTKSSKSDKGNDDKSAPKPQTIKF